MIKKENYLAIHTENFLIQVNLNVKSIEDLIIQLKDINKEIREKEKVEYYIISKTKLRNW